MSPTSFASFLLDDDATWTPSSGGCAVVASWYICRASGGSQSDRLWGSLRRPANTSFLKRAENQEPANPSVTSLSPFFQRGWSSARKKRGTRGGGLVKSYHCFRTRIIRLQRDLLFFRRKRTNCYELSCVFVEKLGERPVFLVSFQLTTGFLTTSFYRKHEKQEEIVSLTEGRRIFYATETDFKCYIRGCAYSF